MEHMLVKASISEATDQGTFTAVISTVSIDRDTDIVEPMAVVTALQKWGPLGKKIPLAWNHGGPDRRFDPEDIIGHIEPESVHEVKGEVVADGWVDRDSERGPGAWRLIKSGTLGFSYGFLVPAGGAVKLSSGGHHIKQLDIFEVTATPIPANGDTRVLSYKNLDEIREEMFAMTQELARDAKREAPPVPADLMAKAFDSFKPTGKTAEEVAGDLDGLALEGGTLYVRLLAQDEVEGVKAGEIKAVWSTAYVNNLPDSAFLYVESGEKDSEGKTTPRSKRHFPYKDAGGTVDLPHLRNALARIPQSSLPQDVKDRLTSKAQGILDRSKSVDVADKEKDPTKGGSRSVDPLVKEATALATQFERESSGFPRKQTTASPAPLVDVASPDELQRQVFEEMLVHLRGEFNGR